MLPKIHKPTIPGRPIISGCDSPTEKLSIFVDHYLKTLVPLTPSYIKDTNHFLQQVFTLPTPLPHNTLVTLDVVSLYTNIPHEEGIAASLEALSTLPPGSTPPLQVFHRFLTFILKHNFFSFNNQFYLQLHGTAMGTESQLLKHSPNPHPPLLWKRYIDDIFMVWPHGQPALEQFLQYINTFHHTIKFQHSFSTTHIDFDHNTHNTRTYTILNSLHQTHRQHTPPTPLLPSSFCLQKGYYSQSSPKVPQNYHQRRRPLSAVGETEDSAPGTWLPKPSHHILLPNCISHHTAPTSLP